MSLTMMTSPLVMTRIFTHYTNGDAGIILPGAPLVVSAFCIVLSMIPFAVIVMRRKTPAQASPGVSA
jgi:hypothetical protein